MTNPSAPTGGALPARRRLTSLDGLRGIAALVVVLHHTLLTSAPLAMAYTANTDRVTGTWTRALAFSPLHLVWAGREAVYVFFVLSGLVLTLPVLGERARQWRTWAVYYPKRLVRLYVPVWGALVLTVVLVALRSGFDPITGASWWLNRHFVDLDAQDLLDNALLTSTSWINSPLWSLHWEVVFSLVLPVVVLLAVVLRRWSWVVAVVALGVAGWGGARDDHALLYLPMFVLGVLMALHLDALLQGARQLTSLAWWLLLPVVLALLSSTWWLTDVLAPVLPLVGAVLVVLAFMAWPADPVRRPAGGAVARDGVLQPLPRPRARRHPGGGAAARGGGRGGAARRRAAVPGRGRGLPPARRAPVPPAGQPGRSCGAAGGPAALGARDDHGLRPLSPARPRGTAPRCARR